MYKDNQAIPHVTADEIECDLVAFRALLDKHGEVMLVDDGIPIARLLPPANFKESGIQSPPTLVEKPHGA